MAHLHDNQGLEYTIDTILKLQGVQDHLLPQSKYGVLFGVHAQNGSSLLQLDLAQYFILRT
jgi:hypothetical protein